MLSELYALHNEVMATTPLDFIRPLLNDINWSNQAVCILGDRGVGKTTLLCQRLLEEYKTDDKGLYISADNVLVIGVGLFKIAMEYFGSGGEAIFIDEVHKYPGWSVEVKNIIDTYKKKKVIISGSSSIDLVKSKGDLSRRVVYYSLPGLSFREYLKLSNNIDCDMYNLDDILHDHVSIAGQFKSMGILKHFHNYLSHGYYPIFTEGTADYLAKVSNVIDKVIYEDIAVIYKLKQSTLVILKKLLSLVATVDGLTPNIDKISKQLQVTRDSIYDCFSYLDQAGLTKNIYPDSLGMKLIRKPGKTFLNNTNLLHAITGALKLETNTGAIRETVFVNQVSVATHRLNLHPKSDFIVDGKFVIEVGGRSKSNRQLKGINEHAYLALDGIEVGYRHKIPLYLFGLLY